MLPVTTNENESAKELEELIKQEQEKPGIIELMKVYGRSAEMLRICNEYLGVNMTKNTTSREILKDRLVAMGADGLCNITEECGCGFNDLAPCDCINLDECVPARKIGDVFVAFPVCLERNKEEK